MQKTLINTSGQPAFDWRDAMISGNGTMGIMVYGQPVRETVVLNHEKLYEFLGTETVEPADLAPVMPRVKELIRDKQYHAAYYLTEKRALEAGHPGLLWTDPYHPACTLCIEEDGQERYSGYERSLTCETGEVQVRWQAGERAYARCSFVSRRDNVIAVRIGSSPPPFDETRDIRVFLEHQINREELLKKSWSADFQRNIDVLHPDISSSLNTPLVEEPEKLVRIVRGQGRLSFRTVYQLADRAYEVALLLRSETGRIASDGTALTVSGAGGTEILIRIVPLDSRRESRLEETFRELEELPSYKDLLGRHSEVHGEMFRRVRLELDKTGWQDGTNEELIADQKGRSDINPYLLEKMFAMGIFGIIASSGDNPPNLTGIWNGEWRPAWSGDFTTDANVNLQMAPVSLAGLQEGTDSYMKLLERIAPDWEVNARKLFGCRGYVAGTRTSGRRNFHTHFIPFPGHYWTAGAPWLLQPCFEYWQCSGDRDFMIRRLLPMMKKSALFFEDFLDMEDGLGHYLIAPSYSPENCPSNLKPDIGGVANAAMDIAVIRELLSRLIEVHEELGLEEEKIPLWQEMLGKLPPYLINQDGALKEWAREDLDDNYDHRHVSHLYPVWPGLEINPEECPELFTAARKAAERRGRGNGSAHGLAHMALLGARLKMADLVYGNCLYLLKEGYLYRSLFTSHNPGRIYNSDALHSLPAAVMEMLVYSRPGRIELLPALSGRLGKGCITGVRCRTRAILESLSWDLPGGSLSVRIKSLADQTITLQLKRSPLRVRRDGGEEDLRGQDRFEAVFRAGECRDFRFSWK